MTTGAPLRWLSNRPLTKCRLPGPAEPAQTVSFVGQEGVGAGGETGDLLVADVDPLHVLAADRVGHVVQGVADDAVATPGARFDQGVDDDVADEF